MSPLLVALCYGAAVAFSLTLLWYFGVQYWIWHALSFISALILGLTPLPEKFADPTWTLAVGCVFLVLFSWGAVAPLFALLPSHKMIHHHRH